MAPRRNVFFRQGRNGYAILPQDFCRHTLHDFWQDAAVLQDLDITVTVGINKPRRYHTSRCIDALHLSRQFYLADCPDTIPIDEDIGRIPFFPCTINDGAVLNEDTHAPAPPFPGANRS